MSRSALIPVTALLGALLASCTNSDCQDYRTTLPLASFYTDPGSGAPQQVAFDSITVAGVGVPSDSLLLDNARQASETFLPLDPARRSCSFALIYSMRPLMADTVTIAYTPRPHFASAECGVVYYYDIEALDHTSLLIDSVSCLTDPVTNRPVENFRIYFHYNPAPDPLP